jgi:hypothetical protein
MRSFEFGGLVAITGGQNDGKHTELTSFSVAVTLQKEVSAVGNRLKVAKFKF